MLLHLLVDIKNRELPAYALVNGTDQKDNIMLICNGSKENNFKTQHFTSFCLGNNVFSIQVIWLRFDFQVHAQLAPIESLSHTVWVRLG